VRVLVFYSGGLPEGWQAGKQASFSVNLSSDRLGWKEVVVLPVAGVALSTSSVGENDLSHELTAYPQDRLTSPLDVREARFSFQAGSPGFATATLPAPAAARTRAVPAKSANGFARLVSHREMTPAFVAFSLLAAVAWGAAHALGPGHGKTIVAAYLVGERGTARHALILGITVTLTHTSTVVTLGLVTLYASRFVATQELYLWLSVASGLLVIAMGGLLFFSRLRPVLRGRVGVTLNESQARPGDHGHSHGDHYGHNHAHSPARPGLRSLVALGISGGLLPCPTALVVMLAAIALDRISYGLVLIVAFSAGLAGVLTGIGLLLVYTRQIAGRSARMSALSRRFHIPAHLVAVIPLGSAAIIFVAGLILTSNALATR
jgi:nickel/cobalt exporter